MHDEVILKKADQAFFALVPDLGIVEQDSSAEGAFEKAIAKKRSVEAAFASAGATHLLERKHEGSLAVRVWSQRLKKWIGLSLIIYFVGLLALGFVIKRSADRMATSLHASLIDPDPKRIDKNVVKFRELLQKYQPFIDEWEKATDKKDK